MISKSSIQDYSGNRILQKENDYIYILPNELLRPYISHYTLTFPNKNIISDNYTVIPNGSSTLVFTFDGNKIGNRLYGTATRINKVGDEANLSIELLIISFRPCGLFQFIKQNQRELTDHLLPVESVDFTLYKAIYNIFDQSEGIYELISKLDNVFLSYLDRITLSSEVVLTMDKIKGSNGMISVSELSKHIYYSERHLNRIFGQCCGMNVKSFLKLVRMNKAIKLLQNPQNNMTMVALQSGFYDQPHFIHEFKSICNITPQEYLDNMSDFYNQITES